MSPSWTLERLAQEGLGWLVVLAYFAGLLVCGLNWRVSHWVKVMTLGFFGLLAVGTITRTITFLMRLRILSVEGPVQSIFLLSQIGYFVSWAILVAGLAGVFSDIRGRLERYR